MSSGRVCLTEELGWVLGTEFATTSSQPHQERRFTVAERESRTRDHIGMSCEQPPCAALVFPNVGEAPRDDTISHEAGTWGVGERRDRLEAHNEGVGAVGQDELDLALEAREVDDLTVHERVQHGLPSDDHTVVGRVDSELLGPETFERRHIAVQCGHSFLIIEHPHAGLIRRRVLCHSRRPERQSNEQ
jgi:hypothetical protein